MMRVWESRSCNDYELVESVQLSRVSKPTNVRHPLQSNVRCRYASKGLYTYEYGRNDNAL